MSQSQNQITVTNISGGGSPPIPISRSLTYQQLLTNIGAGTLVTGESILITDFQIITYIQFSGAIGSEEIHYGSVEPMVARAISPTQLAPQIVSTIYPTDIINYEPIFADREYDAVNVVGITSTGVITKREDIKGNARNYDWRNIIFRRWETISGSGIYDSITDTGFARNDYPAFDVTIAFNHFVGSPLGFSGYGIQYWLDNVVSIGFTAVNTIGLGYGCTVQGQFANNKLGSMFYTNCLADFSANTITTLNTASFSAECQGNYGESWQNLTVVGNCQINNVIEINSTLVGGYFENNICIKIVNNNTSGDLRNNDVSQIQNNNTGIIEISYNVGFSIANNMNGTIVNNDCYSLNDNDMLNAGEINNNICSNLNNNSIQYIHGNIVINLNSNNFSNTGSGTDIRANFGLAITNNTLDDAAIIANNIFGSTIDSNTIDIQIYQNNFSDCIRNKMCNITQNTSDVISYNENIAITNNNVNDISSNITPIGSGAHIELNIGQSISSNTGFVAIISNTSHDITINTDTDIQSNQVGNISTNVGTFGNSFITSNLGGEIANNINIASIQLNSVAVLSNNDFVAHSFLGNTGYDFQQNTVNGGDIVGCDNVRMESCVINTRGISANNFLTGLISYTFSPTPTMAAASPTITMYDNILGQVEQKLSSGVLTYTAF